MTTCQKARENMELWLTDWSFVTFDADGLSGGLITTWSPHGKVLNSSFHSFSISINVESKELGSIIRIINIYGPYSN